MGMTLQLTPLNYTACMGHHPSRANFLHVSSTLVMGLIAVSRMWCSGCSCSNFRKGMFGAKCRLYPWHRGASLFCLILLMQKFNISELGDSAQSKLTALPHIQVYAQCLSTGIYVHCIRT